MSDASNRAEHYRDLAAEYRRLAMTSSSTQTRDRYRRMAAYYSELAEAEAQGTRAREDRDLPFDGPT